MNVCSRPEVGAPSFGLGSKEASKAQPELLSGLDLTSDGWMCDPEDSWPLPDPEDELWSQESTFVEGAVTLGSLSPELSEQWCHQSGYTLEDFIREVFDHTSMRLGELTLSTELREGILQMAELRMTIHDRETDKFLGRAYRSFNFTPIGGPEVELGGFDLEPEFQGRGYGQSLLSSSLATYQRMGITKVGVWVSEGDPVGFAWAKYGLQPGGRRETAALFASVKTRMAELSLSREAAERVQEILSKRESKGLWEIADLEDVVKDNDGSEIPLGQALLSGASWFGVLDLADEPTRKRLQDYIHLPEMADSSASNDALHENLLATGRSRVPRESVERLLASGLTLEDTLALLNTVGPGGSKS